MTLVPCETARHGEPHLGADHDLVPCKCNFAALKNAKVNKLYRVRLTEGRWLGYYYDIDVEPHVEIHRMCSRAGLRESR